jgi:hypothetical protein
MMPFVDEAPGAPAEPSPRNDLIERWFVEHFHGAPAMRDTEAYNHARRAVDDLKRRLAEEH